MGLRLCRRCDHCVLPLICDHHSGLGSVVDRPADLLGGMWAVVATIFVFRESRESSLSAGLARLIATCVSFALCLAYLLTFPVTGLGIGVVIGLGTIAMTLLGRRDDIVTTGITTAVVLVVAEINPEQAWQHQSSDSRTPLSASSSVFRASGLDLMRSIAASEGLFANRDLVFVQRTKCPSA